MKLLFFISSLRSGGAERVMSVLTNELAERDYKVTVALMTDSQSFYELDPRIKVKCFSFEKKNNFYGKLKNRLNLFSFIRNLSKEEKPDVIVSFIYQMNTNVLLSTRFLGIPVIVSEHNTLNKKMSMIEKLQRLYLSRWADKLTILTQHDFNYLGNRLKNKVVMSNPLPFRPIDVYNEDRDKVILAVGSIIRYNHKGFDNLVDIWSHIADRYPDWKLQIAGEFDEASLDHLNKIEQNKNHKNKIQYLGQVRDMTNLLKRSSIFILSSRWEGFPMVLIEAMSQGCACISYDLISGPNEIITHNYDGVLVKDQDKKEMVRELTLLIENQEKQKYLARNAIRSINRFSVERTVDRWEELFKELINIKKRSISR